MISTSKLAPYAHYILADAVIPELPGYYRGKVRENYDLRDGARILIATDRVSAFDRNLAVIPLKGQVLTQTARFWFEATQSLCPNHVIEYPDLNVLVSKRLRMMPVEIVVRDYLGSTTSTSVLQMYKKGAREMYGHCFAEGAGAVCVRHQDGGAAGVDPGRHQIRIRFRCRRRHHPGRRDSHPGQQPLLACRELSRALCRRRAARRAGQGLHPALGGSALRSLYRSHS